MAQLSAGLLMYRIRDARLQVFLVHPGGPFFAKKDEGAWTIPKGEPNEGEELLATAQREFTEETGLRAEPPFVELAFIRQKAGKVVHAWGFEGDFDPASCVSNSFTIEWPPKSGKMKDFPEIDRADYFDLELAKRKMNPAQIPLIEELEKKLREQGIVP